MKIQENLWNKISFNKNEKKTKSCWHTVYSYGKIINVAERAAGKYNIGADLASEKNKKTSWHKWSDVIIYKSCWRRTIRTIEIRSERKVKKVLDRWGQKWYYIKVVAEQKSSEQQNKLKKFLTNKKNCDKIIKLLTHKKRITKKDLWQLNNKTTLKILMNFSDDFSKNQRTFFIENSN